MRRGLTSLLLAFLVLAAPAAKAEKLPKPSFPLTVKVNAEGTPVLSWHSPDKKPPRQRTLLRSTTDLRVTKDAMTYPIAALDANQAAGRYRDEAAPQDVALWYQLKVNYGDGRVLYSTAVKAVSPGPRRLPPLGAPSIVVDKRAYMLTLLDNKMEVKRYPIALGANPVIRKLHLDRASTPEGHYRINGVQPNATYHKAFDIDYPNEVDKIRYRVLSERGELPKPAPDIGGEIQIHGCGIVSNWTWGCIAMRDGDIDQLFTARAIGNGTPVTISGSELSANDLFSALSLSAEERAAYTEILVKKGFASGRTERHWLYALCRYQAASGRLVTGVFDLATRKLFERGLAARKKR